MTMTISERYEQICFEFQKQSICIYFSDISQVTHTLHYTKYYGKPAGFVFFNVELLQTNKYF